MIYRALVAVLLLVLACPAQAARTNIAAELLVEHSAAPGAAVDLALVMRPAAGWHGYWSNPGDAGLGMQLDWRLPAGFKAGEPRYPVPETLLIQGLMNHVYSRPYAVIVPLTVPANAPAGQVLPIAVDAQWLACTDSICVPERATLTAEIMVAKSGRRDARFDGWRQSLPAPLGAPAHFAIAGDRLRLAIPLPAAVVLNRPHLFIAQDKVVAYAGAQSFSRAGDMLIAEIPRAKFAAFEPASLDGVLRLGADRADGLAFAATPGMVAPPGEPLDDPGGTAPFALLLLGALAGGLLLNIMPCVFPILSLKALSLARAGGSESHARAEGLAYTAGVVTACLALGALLLALRAAGQEVGWAFQLQEPVVVHLLLLLAVAITANLAGLFEFAVPGFAQSGSAKGAFATGLLAAFVATPCTGPFMAAAMGAALLLPVIPALALFGALGLGIALPFLAIAFVPALRRVLPKPGPWMNRFRKVMAVPMGLTALALFWLCWRLGGKPELITGALLTCALLGGLAWAGRKQRAGLGGARVFAQGLLPALLVSLVLIPMAKTKPAESAIESILSAIPFSENALAKARASGKPVFLYFTADWCLTCKVNERVAIEREETRRAFAEAGVQVLVGDWTRRDPAITRFLTAQSVAGVPLYLWYPAGGGSPQQLPQVLGPASLTDLAEAPRAQT